MTSGTDILVAAFSEAGSALRWLSIREAFVLHGLGLPEIMSQDAYRMVADKYTLTALWDLLGASWHMPTAVVFYLSGMMHRRLRAPSVVQMFSEFTMRSSC